MAKRRSKSNRKPKEKKRDSNYYLKKFFFWFIVYAIFIILLTILFENTQTYQNKIGFYLIMGYLLVLISRVVYSATKGRSLRLNGIVIWGLIYTVVFGVLSYFLGLLPKIQINSVYDKYISIIIFSIIFTVIIMFLRRMKIKGGKRRSRRAPSQIFTGIILLIASLLFFRFSHVVFLQWFNWPEGMAWSWLIGLGFLIGGILTLVAWWRNNVLQHRVGIKIGRWN